MSATGAISAITTPVTPPPAAFTNAYAAQAVAAAPPTAVTQASDSTNQTQDNSETIAANAAQSNPIYSAVANVSSPTIRGSNVNVVA